MGKRLTRGQAIKQYCRYECCANDLVEWKECSRNECPLWNFRFGRELHPVKKGWHRKKNVEMPNSEKIVVPAIKMTKLKEGMENE